MFQRRRWASLGTSILGLSAFLMLASAVHAQAFFDFGELDVYPRVVEVGEPVNVSASVSNIGSQAAEAPTNVFVDGVLADSEFVSVDPGDSARVEFTVEFSRAGRHHVGVANESPLPVQAVEDRAEGPGIIFGDDGPDPVFVFGFDGVEVADGSSIPDLSANGNDGVVVGNVEAVDGVFGDAVRTYGSDGYIEVPESDTTVVDGWDTLTMATWIYPRSEQGYADFLTKGDWNVLQTKEDNTLLNFYTGGWERGEATFEVPANWNERWHHVAGVTDGNLLKLYVDGVLLGTQDVSPGIPSIDQLWNIGRDADRPDRVFDGYIDEVRVYQEALSQDEIVQVMLGSSE